MPLPKRRRDLGKSNIRSHRLVRRLTWNVGSDVASFSIVSSGVDPLKGMRLGLRAKGGDLATEREPSGHTHLVAESSRTGCARGYTAAVPGKCDEAPSLHWASHQVKDYTPPTSNGSNCASLCGSWSPHIAAAMLPSVG